MLQRHWRMMGALEAAGGMLLFGISRLHFRDDAGVHADALLSIWNHIAASVATGSSKALTA